MKKFSDIRALAAKRKGGEEVLSELLTPPKSEQQLANIPDDRYLSQMTQCVFNAGFNWGVISKKWPGFEEAFHQFDLATLLSKPPEEWERYVEDERIVRNWQKIQTVYQNAAMIDDIAAEHGSFADFFSQWPTSDQIGLTAYLKKHGARLGGNTGQYFIRFMGKDGFLTSSDVVAALIANGVDIKPKPTSQSDMKKIQAAFNHWHEESGLAYSHISRLLAYTVGDNIDMDVLMRYRSYQNIDQNVSS